MIFPFGGEKDRDLTEILFRRLPPERTSATPDPCFDDVPVCIDRAGVGRKKHSRDKDGRCVFCDRQLGPKRRGR